MLNSGKKIRALRDKKKILTRVSERYKKPYPPSLFKLNGRSLIHKYFKFLIKCFCQVNIKTSLYFTSVTQFTRENQTKSARLWY